MTQPAKKLTALVSELIDCNRNLVSLCKDKQSAILERDAEELETLTQQQEELSSEIQELNERRRDVSEDIIPDQDKPVSLETIVETMDSALGQQLDDLRTELKQVVRDVQRFSRENMRLLENQMTIFDRLFEELESEQSQETYDSDREKDQSGTGEAMLFNEAV
jgi:flagellar biosynthesis/type III secretory pathway chaperone